MARIIGSSFSAVIRSWPCSSGMRKWRMAPELGISVERPMRRYTSAAGLNLSVRRLYPILRNRSLSNRSRIPERSIPAGSTNHSHGPYPHSRQLLSLRNSAAGRQIDLRARTYTDRRSARAICQQVVLQLDGRGPEFTESPRVAVL